MNEHTEDAPTVGWSASDIHVNKTWQVSAPPCVTRVCKRLIALCTEATGTDNMSPIIPEPLHRLVTEALSIVQSDLGFALIRGLPVEAPERQLSRFLLTLGRAIGQIMPQNPAGETVCEVRNRGGDVKVNRGYLSHVALPFHSDTADILGLLCVRPAAVGGDSALVSSLRVRARLAAERPDLLRTLEHGFQYAYPEGKGDVTEPIPVFSTVNGQVSCRYLRAFIEAAGNLTDLEREALDALDEIAMAPQMALRLRLGPGDLLLVNNYTVLHSRTDFEDCDDSSRARLLLRLWLNVPGFRSLNPLLALQARRFVAEAQ